MGNFEYDTRQSDLERVFSKHGRIERVDMKSGNEATLHFPGYLLSLVVV